MGEIQTLELGKRLEEMTGEGRKRFGPLIEKGLILPRK